MATTVYISTGCTLYSSENRLIAEENELDIKLYRSYPKPLQTIKDIILEEER